MPRKWIYTLALLLLLLSILWMTSPHTSVSAHSLMTVVDTPTPTPDANAILNQANAANNQAQSLNMYMTIGIGILGVVLTFFAFVASGLALYGFTSFRSITDLKKQMSTDLEAMRQNATATHGSLIYLTLGDRLMSNGATKEAIESYRKAGTFSPKDDQLNYVLGRIYSNAGYFDDAIRVLGTATETNPDYAEAWKELGLAYRRRGQKMHDPEDYSKALEYLKKAVSLKHYDDDTYAIMGGLHQRKEEYRQALARYTQAHNLNPDSPYPLGNMASLSLYLGKASEASEYFEKTEKAANARIATGKPDIPWDYYDLALSRLGLGKPNAIDSYKQAIAHTPPPERVIFESVLDNLKFLQEAKASLPDLPKVIQIIEEAKSKSL
jgi:tetratricopeptide (TPR) repeat protein